MRRGHGRVHRSRRRIVKAGEVEDVGMAQNLYERKKEGKKEYQMLEYLIKC